MKKLTEKVINSTRARLKFDDTSLTHIAKAEKIDRKSVYRIANNLAHKNVPYPSPAEFANYKFYPGNKVFSTTKNKFLKTKNGKVKLVDINGKRETVVVENIIDLALVLI